MAACSLSRASMPTTLLSARYSSATYMPAVIQPYIPPRHRHTVTYHASEKGASSAPYTNRNLDQIDQLLSGLGELRQKQQQGLAAAEAEDDDYDEFEDKDEGSLWVWWRAEDVETVEAGSSTPTPAVARGSSSSSNSSTSTSSIQNEQNRCDTPAEPTKSMGEVPQQDPATRRVLPAVRGKVVQQSSSAVQPPAGGARIRRKRSAAEAE